MHFLVANQLDYTEITTIVNEQLQKKKAELEKKAGRKASKEPEDRSNQFMGLQMKRTAKKSAKKVAIKKSARSTSRFGQKTARAIPMKARKAFPMNSAFGNTGLFGANNSYQDDAQMEDEEENETLENFSIYYNQNIFSHRELYK